MHTIIDTLTFGRSVCMYSMSEQYAILSQVLQNVSAHTHENFKEMHSTGKDTDN